MRLNRLFLLLALLSIAGAAARADEASKARKVEELFAVARLEEMFSQSMTMAMNQVKTSVMQETLGVNLPPEKAKLLEEMQGKVEAVVRTALSWDQMRPQYIKLYADAFSEGQLDELLAFYRSPAGQAMVSSSPMLMKRGAEIAQQRMTAAQPELKRLVEEFLEKTQPQ
jgi:hypothetical protein